MSRKSLGQKSGNISGIHKALTNALSQDAHSRTGIKPPSDIELRQN